MAKVVLQGARVVAIICELEPTGMAEHVRVDGEWHLGGLPDTRALQHYLGHKNIQHTVRYTEMAPDRFKDFWRD